jgi:hypothetical protein
LRHQGERETQRLFRQAGRNYHRFKVGSGYAPGTQVRAFDRTYVVVNGGAFRVLDYNKNVASDIYTPVMTVEVMRQAVEGLLEAANLSDNGGADDAGSSGIPNEEGVEVSGGPEVEVSGN